MKKIFTLALLSVGLLVSSTVNAQSIQFGVKGGLNVTDMKIDKKVFDKSNQIGAFVGPTVKFSLPIVGLGIDASALYDFHQAKITDAAGESQTVKQHQIAIPVNLRYTIGLGSTANVFFFAGPQWGINIGEKDFKWTKGSSYSLAKSNFSMNVGLGVTLLKHLQLNANYNVALGKTADVNFCKAVETTGQQIIDKEKSRNNSWQIGLAYYF